MKYVIRVNYLCPEGSIASAHLWIADGEATLAAILAACAEKVTYVEATCLGVIETPNEYMHGKIAECMSNAPAEARRLDAFVGRPVGKEI